MHAGRKSQIATISHPSNIKLGARLRPRTPTPKIPILSFFMTLLLFYEEIMANNATDKCGAVYIFIITCVFSQGNRKIPSVYRKKFEALAFYPRMRYTVERNTEKEQIET